MTVHGGLPGGLSSVHSNIRSCDARVPLIHEIPRSTNKVVTRATLCSTERKVVGHVSPRNYEEVVLGDRICIANNDRQRVTQHNLAT